MAIALKCAQRGSRIIQESSGLLSITGSKLSQQPRRTVLLPPQYWYFIDTEGNLNFTHQRRRYFEKAQGEQESEFSLNNVENLLQSMQGDLPMRNMPNPYKKPRQKCILCKYDVEVDYKNPRLLSQFVSRFTGKLYDRQTTGLCRYRAEQVVQAIKMSQRAGFMPYVYTEPIYYNDPKLFDPFNPSRKS
ncbi:hypothetical protein RvY_05551 [Ramazzottius varieornatus]|uniref:28S ribosomal protein S18b, mitochondrial n=1 Tax=Ramazzottius varieornatus TaxID=947166 RepID=A0A1D1UVE4_RAMVA|nr:hypothetical protein RvY_05551 [Ramazzottius varieornatus]